MNQTSKRLSQNKEFVPGLDPGPQKNRLILLIYNTGNVCSNAIPDQAGN